MFGFLVVLYVCTFAVLAFSGDFCIFYYLVFLKIFFTS